jgi:hypothetical protein
MSQYSPAEMCSPSEQVFRKQGLSEIAAGSVLAQDVEADLD